MLRRSELKRQWPGHDFSQLEEVWWTTDEPGKPEAVCPEHQASPWLSGLAQDHPRTRSSACRSRLQQLTAALSEADV